MKEPRPLQIAGFTLIEVLMASAAVALSAIILSNVIYSVNVTSGSNARKFALLAIRNNLTTLILRNDSMSLTMMDTKNLATAGFSIFNTSPLTTAGSGGVFRVCTGQGYAGSPPAYNAPVNCGAAGYGLYFDPISDATAGFTDGGANCSGFTQGAGGNLSCTIQPQLSWKCYPTTSPNCATGLMVVTVDFLLSTSATQAGGFAINPHNFKFNAIVPTTFGASQVIGSSLPFNPPEAPFLAPGTSTITVGTYPLQLLFDSKGNLHLMKGGVSDWDAAGFSDALTYPVPGIPFGGSLCPNCLADLDGGGLNLYNTGVLYWSTLHPPPNSPPATPPAPGTHNAAPAGSGAILELIDHPPFMRVLDQSSNLVFSAGS